MNRTLIEDEHSDNPMTDSELEARMCHWLADQWTALLICDGDAIVGYVLYQHQPDRFRVDRRNDVYIRHFYIERKFRRRGIGRAAFEKIVHEWFPSNVSVTLDVLDNNPDGLQFWKRLGFVAYSTTLRRVHPEGSHL